MSLYASLWAGLLQPAYERLRGRITPRLERELDASQWWTPERLADWQWRELGRLLVHAQARVPFYRDWFAQSGLAVEDLVRARDLSPLPVITRAQLMAEPARFQAQPRPSGSYVKATGGSSGQPLRFWLDPRSDQWRLAISRRGYLWAGCRPGLRQVHLWSGDLVAPGRRAAFKRGVHRALQGQVYIDCYHLGPAELDRALGIITRFRPQVLVAFTSAALILARHAARRGWRPPDSLQGLITGAEGLSDPDRRHLEEAWACPVFQTYGSREFMLIASECPARQGLHLSAENLLVEVLDRHGAPCAPGQVGRVVISDLHNHAQPFIRYQNDDLAAPAGQACACGRGLPLLERVEGRLMDLLRTPDGRELTGAILPHLLKDFPAIAAYQARQERLDRLVLNLVLNRPLTPEESGRVRSVLEKALPGVAIEIQRVDELERTSSGKVRVTIGLNPEDLP
jgi:phenylacetate-CoA ligase